jgi:hypothetical protein
MGIDRWAPVRRSPGNGDDADDAETAGSGFAVTHLSPDSLKMGTAARDALAS